MPEDVVPSLSSPDMKPSGAGQGDEAGAQPSNRSGGGRSQVVPADHQNITPQDESRASTAIYRLSSANPEPTAANPGSVQVEGGALSLLGSREMPMREPSQAWDCNGPCSTPGAGYFGSTSCGAWSSSLWPDQRLFQRLRSVCEGAEA
ncbi:unnamed protein product [Phytophthora fragariaefolia]|uniref:Unnamed protein product n=1 Tax=Phytophthora fragariaefolia TaxID=1490495 RepID=A0A9W6Y0G4_9STRA|nr:unnamed protein product [Phytophthora fragariaefolia]